MNEKTMTGLLVTAAVVLLFVIPLLPVPLWGHRGLMILLLVGAGYVFTPPLALIPGIFAIPADIMTLLDIERSFTALTFLYWSLLVLVPYVVANSVEISEGDDEESDGESPSGETTARVDRSPARDAGLGQTPTPGETDGEAFERLQWLIKRRLDEVRTRYGINLLLVYDVHQNRARLGYAVDPDDEVNRDVTFRADSGQGIGWVLRHEEELDQRRENIDWRNLQYRSRPGDLARVKMIPLHEADELVGVLVVEWTSEPDRADVGKFVEELEHLMALRREIHQLRKNQNVVQIMEQLHDLNPLRETGFDGMIHRSLEIVESFVPVDEGHVEFFSYEEGIGSDDVVHQGRRAVYEECMNWIKESGEILRVDDLTNHRLGHESLNRFGQVEVRSFLGGAVEKEGELVGMICLDHPSPNYFTRQDAELLKIILNHLSQVLRVGRRLEDLDRQQAEYRRLLELFQIRDTELTYEEYVHEQVHRFVEHLPVISAGYYEYAAGGVRMRAYEGEGTPSETFEDDHALVRRINSAETYGTMLTFPELSRFDGYEAPLNADGLKVATVADGHRPVGFFTLFVNNVDKLDDVLFEEFERILPLILAPAQLMYRREQLKEDNRRDPITDLLRFDPWKQRLGEEVETGDHDQLVIWYVRVPGFEKIAEQRGRDRARNWLKSTAQLLGELLEKSVMTRSYAGTFVGYEIGPAEQMEDRLETVSERLSDWSFPAGKWPRPPECGFARYQEPFPATRKLIHKAFQQSKRKASEASEE